MAADVRAETPTAAAQMAVPDTSELAEMLDDMKKAMVCLVKPQFEAGREQVGKNGIVRDTGVHLEVVEKCVGYAEENGLYPYGLTFSPVKGAKGNIEFLLYVGKNQNLRYNLSCIQTVVKSSHEELK